MANDTSKIVYVDDEEANRFVFTETFADEFDVVCVPDAAAALSFLENHHVAVVMSDQRMPRTPGDVLMAEIRDRWPGIIRMMVTAFADMQLILPAVNAGLVARYVVKPWEEDEVREMLRWGLQAHAASFESPGRAVQERLLESERLATLGAIHASFLHELGAPLSYISGSVNELTLIEQYRNDLLEVIGQQGSAKDPHWAPLKQLLLELPEILDNLRTGSALLSHLRDDVRRLIGPFRARNEQGCSGDEVVRAAHFAIAVNKRESTLAKARLLLKLPQNIPSLPISVDNLMLILINLVRNAIQALPSRASGNEVIVQVELRDEEALAISVIDNGEGMSDSLVNSLGKQFLSTRSQGMGLGVYKARALAEAAGGTLTYTSQRSCGTTAEVLIPVKVAPGSE